MHGERSPPPDSAAKSIQATFPSLHLLLPESSFSHSHSTLTSFSLSRDAAGDEAAHHFVVAVAVMNLKNPMEEVRV